MSLAKKDWFITGTRMIPTEEEEQKTVISWCRLNETKWPELGLIYHVPNEGKRSKATAAAEKAMGLRAGVSDLCLPVRTVWFPGLYLEMKALDGKLTKEQREFLTAVGKQGYCCCACWGADAAMGLIERYLKGRQFPYAMDGQVYYEGVEVF